MMALERSWGKRKSHASGTAAIWLRSEVCECHRRASTALISEEPARTAVGRYRHTFQVEIELQRILTDLLCSYLKAVEIAIAGIYKAKGSACSTTDYAAPKRQ
jgi:hypothetical protein